MPNPSTLALSPGILRRPAIAPRSHPVETGAYTFPTPAISAMHDAIVRWVYNQSPGGIVYGQPRLGKTQAIHYLLHILAESLGGSLPIYSMRCKHVTVANEAVFMDTLIKAVGYAILSGRPHVKQERLVRFLHQEVTASGQHRMILFLDDAQNLLTPHYQWLMDLHNELDALGVRLTALLVGQEELYHQRSVFLEAGQRQIVGRFMVQHHRFYGIRNAAELHAFLHEYDAQEYPAGSGWSFSRYYFPEAFEQNDWRLGALADRFWSAFMKERLKAGLRGTTELPMMYVSRATDYVLRTFGSGSNSRTPLISDDELASAALNSGYIEAEVGGQLITSEGGA